MKTCRLLAMLSCLLLLPFFGSGQSYPFRDPSLDVQARVKDLLGRLTPEEKVAQMMHGAPAIPRLGIPAYNWWNECLHGVARAGRATVFPQAVGIAATFNDSLIFRMADVISTEARAKYHEALRRGEHGIYQGLTFWSPNINIFRDPRWGRGMETYGEDPFLTGRIGVAFVKGLQGSDPRYLKTVATAKHYAVHSGPEPDRHRFNALSSRRDLFETYLPAFEALIREGGARSVMCAYNRYMGEPCCGSTLLLKDILRDAWGFDGYVVSDCWAVSDFWDFHKFLPGKDESVARAVVSGTDLECGVSYSALLDALKKGFITQPEIDLSLGRLFEARIQLGMFDPENRVPYASIPFSALDAQTHKDMALQVARESIVLLKNEQQTLPLKQPKRILVCGPNAHNEPALWGNYNGVPAETVTPYEGIKALAGKKTAVTFIKGCDWTSSVVFEDIPTELLQYNSQAGFNAEYFDNVALAGKPVLTRMEQCPNWYFEGGEAAPGVKNDNFSVRYSASLRAPESGDFTFSIEANDGFRFYIDDKLLYDGWTNHSGRQTQVKVSFEKDKAYRIKLECYQKEWLSQVSLHWILPGKSSFDRALEAARQADVIVMCGGISPRLEGEEMPVKIEGFAGGDRTSLDLPKVQTAFLQALKATGKPVVLVLINGSALSINWEAENLPAIVEAWYGGQAAGTALAEALLGQYNPAGRLPVTFYRSVNDLPAFDNYNMEGRTYRFFRGRPLFPFGHGLSYSRFEYQQPELSQPVVSASDTLLVKVQVKNTGLYAGDEVVQLYVAEQTPRVGQPVRSLKGFKRVNLKAGETKTVIIPLPIAHLKTYDEATDAQVIKPGKYELQVGASSEDIRGRREIEVRSKK